mmetsp:Transcript_34962/g.73506  ORF Transcript_34962/g.73506 Transcript_34962/m.73506 type:complete len:224 (+) Transcript_34962:269-940(+)
MCAAALSCVTADTLPMSSISSSTALYFSRRSTSLDETNPSTLSSRMVRRIRSASCSFCIAAVSFSEASRRRLRPIMCRLERTSERCDCEYICDFWTASCICVSSALVISTASVKACASPSFAASVSLASRPCRSAACSASSRLCSSCSSGERPSWISSCSISRSVLCKCWRAWSMSERTLRCWKAGAMASPHWIGIGMSIGTPCRSMRSFERVLVALSCSKPE